MTSSESQKREFFRVPYQGKVTLTRSWYENEGAITYPVEDISGGGLAFWDHTQKPFEQNERLRGILELDHQEIRIYGKVARVTGRRICITYLTLEEGSRSKIIEFCLKRQLKCRTKYYSDMRLIRDR